MKNPHILLFSFLFLFQSAIAQKTENEFSSKEIASIVEEARVEWNIPGIAVGIVYNGEVIFANGFGTCTQDKNEPVDANTQFGIASNTKAFTAMSIAMLVEQGKLSYDDKVTKHLPWFKMYADWITNEMTVKDLLTHHSGLATFSGDLIWYASNHSREEIVKKSQYLKPINNFRDKFGYSNIHYLAAGLIVEKVSGMTFDDFIAQNIFKPMGMTSTNSSITKNPTKNVAQPHAQVDGKNIPIPYVNWDNITPAGGINSNVTDMCKWITALLNNTRFPDKSGTLLASANFTKMLTPVTNLPVSGFSKSMHPSKHFNAYGLGFNLFDYHGSLVVNHSGGLDGMISHVAFVPEKNFGMVILCNAGSGLPGILMYDLLDFMMKQANEDYCTKYYKIIANNSANEKAANDKKWADAKTDAKAPLDNEAYAGKYSGNVYGSVSVKVEKGQLKLTLDHSPTFNATLYYWKDDLFWFEFKEHPSLPRGTVKFKTNEKGNMVTEMIIDCPNPDFDFTELDLIRERK